MAKKVFLHVGLPKTATTYLQTILWDHREEVEAQGVRLPGLARHDHLWSTRIVREDVQFRRVSSKRRLAAWDRIRADVAAWPDTCLISHEFFGAATAEQAARVVADLAPAEVHLVVTAREPLSLFAASWQESIKNRGTTPMADYSTSESEDPNDVWNWRTLDLRLVLERWAPAFAPEHVHVLPLPGSDAPRQLIWDRFAELVGIDPDSVDVSVSFPNASMGVVEAETLRRMNFHLDSFRSAIDRGTFIRSFLADQRLVPRDGERYWPRAEQVADARERGRAAVALVRESGFEVIGDLEGLLVPDDLPERRTPETVTDSEVAAVAVELAATLLHDVRDLRHERRALRSELEAFAAAPVKGVVRHHFPRLGDRLRRVLRRET
ncbi:MAG: hypothetical protein ABIN79_05860 [Marmoricola sp.]